LCFRTDPDAAFDIPATVADQYVRGNDLIVTYAPIRDALTSQIYYRYFEIDSRHPAIDVVLSRQTELLDSNPTVMVSSYLDFGEVLSFENGQFGPTEIRRNGLTAIHSCLVVCRVADQDLSYIEMTHPSDFETSALCREATCMRIERTLFQHRLEKGVIRRGQIRCAFVPRHDDAAMAQRLFEQLMESEPPLTA
jgi:hypothetical protein